MSSPSFRRGRDRSRESSLTGVATGISNRGRASPGGPDPSTSAGFPTVLRR
jgi:hypothetical protein